MITKIISKFFFTQYTLLILKNLIFLMSELWHYECAICQIKE